MNKFKHTQKGLSTLLCLLLANICLCQTFSFTDEYNNSLQQFYKEKKSKKTFMGIEITSSVLPKAKIMKIEGKYKLQSHLQSSYDLGLNFLYKISEKTSISTGIHFVVGKWNFFADLPNQDLTPYISDGRKIIENKELWGAFRIPFLLEKKINSKKWNSMLIRAGINLRYSGLMIDEGIEASIIDANGGKIDFFNSKFSGNNKYKPWLTFLAGGGKIFSLKNKNFLFICLQADISGTYFYTGTYEITIPNQPIATGTYKINGTSLGLSVQYIFTGYNKRLVKSYQKKGF